ncbi:unnamed protein product [Dibothriocephalus latus]|uniref:Tetraspanin n=1 Tax=Dibothriocephalus latus TaxID=60516 RepID=A0A3P6UYQ3_DIBLA|nr:unnamed protein product [Dibothriocephalus latus]
MHDLLFGFIEPHSPHKSESHVSILLASSGKAETLLLIGLVILGFAVFAYLEPAAQELIEASGSRVIATTVIFILMGIGALTLIVALFGCCGAYHESAGLLATYFTFLIIIFTVQVVGATLGYVYRDQVSADFIL